MKYLKYCTINKRSKGMSEVSKVVFATFTQHCIQSNVIHVGGVEGVKYFTEQKIKKAMLAVLKVYCTLYTEAFCPSRGKACTAFCLVGLAVHHQSVQGGSFVNFLGLVNYKGDCRQDTQPIPNS